MCIHYLPLICLLNTNTMITTKRKSKIAKLFSGAQNHKIALLTDTPNIPKVQYIAACELAMIDTQSPQSNHRQVWIHGCPGVHLHPLLFSLMRFIAT